ncbi:MAG: hypothetical protein WD176_00265, partial [Pirellulales bacterium]
VPCDDRILSRAIDSDIKDAEDAVQYFSALRAGAECIVSRNSADFPRSTECPIHTPAEFLAAYSFQQ